MNPATKADGILLTETSFAVAQPITAAQKTRSLQRNGISKKKQEPDMDTDKVTCHKENRYEQNDNEQKKTTLSSLWKFGRCFRHFSFRNKLIL
mmetsp:Transcript_18873/g.25168  ORF Transcript_18873/g.25168 Transcript_18873/m.25168 type:complete len:93 (+) Transcript_18873:260-538(+)